MAATGSKLTDKTDLELVTLALEENSQAAYFALYSRYRGGVSAHISRYIQDATEIEDICMETFEKAFKQLSTYRSENRFSTWVFRIARNTAFDHRDRVKVRGGTIGPSEVSEAEKVELPDETRSPEEEIIWNQTHERLLLCIDALPAHYSAPAKLCFVDNLGYKEIAAELDIPINTVKTRISRAKNLLIQMMQETEQ